MAKNSRRKGKTGELEASSFMTKLTNVKFRRGQQFNGLDGNDIVCEKPHGVRYEVKRVGTMSKRLGDALDQAQRDAGDDVPVVLYREDFGEWTVAVRAKDLPRLVERLYLLMANE